LAKEGQLIPVPTLKANTSVHNFEESTSAKTGWISPLQDCPIADLKKVLDNARHIRTRKFAFKHLSDSGSTLDRLPHDLVVDRVLRVQFRESFHVSSIEGMNPSLHRFVGFSHYRLP